MILRISEARLEVIWVISVSKYVQIRKTELKAVPELPCGGTREWGMSTGNNEWIFPVRGRLADLTRHFCPFNWIVLLLATGSTWCSLAWNVTDLKPCPVSLPYPMRCLRPSILCECRLPIIALTRIPRTNAMSCLRIHRTGLINGGRRSTPKGSAGSRDMNTITLRRLLRLSRRVKHSPGSHSDPHDR
jgi:hypothetical protein